MITLNRRDRVAWHPGMTVAELLVARRFTFPQLSVIINGTVVSHDAYDRTPIPDNADVRVIHLMAGG